MKNDRLAWWAAPPRLVGPLVVVLILLVAVLCGNLTANGEFLEAIFVCAVGVFCLLLALLDLVAEVIRQGELIRNELAKWHKEP